jgi:hypothetical protein
MVAESHQVHDRRPLVGFGAGCAEHDILLAQPEIRPAPVGIVGEDEEAHAADPGAERVERMAVVLRLERSHPVTDARVRDVVAATNVEGNRWHRRLADLSRHVDLLRRDLRSKGEVAAELFLCVLEVRDVLPVAAQIRVVSCLEQLRARLSERRFLEVAECRPPAREDRTAKASDLLDGRKS